MFANLVDFDQQYGHRNDPGRLRAARSSRSTSAWRELLGRLRDDEMCLVTADHGNDPTTPGTDHTREYVPLLVAGPRVRAGADLGTRDDLRRRRRDAGRDVRRARRRRRARASCARSARERATTRAMSGTRVGARSG